MAVRKLLPKTRSNTTGGALKAQTPSPIAHRPSRLATPIEIRPHICTALAADPTGEALLDIGQPGIIGPGIAADRDGVAAAVVGAIDQQPNTPMSRISAKVIFCGRSVMAHDAADRPEREAARAVLIGTVMSASLIGRLRSSTFRLSATAVSMSLTGSCFSSESAPRALPSWDSKTRRNNLLGGLAVNRTAGTKRTYELTSSIVPRGTSFHRWISGYLLTH